MDNALQSLPFRWSLHPPPYRIAGVLELRGNGTYFVEGSPHAAAMPCNLNVRGITIRKKAGADEFIYIKTQSEECVVGYFADKWLRIDVAALPPSLRRSDEPSPQPPPRLLRPRPGALRHAVSSNPTPAEPDSESPDEAPEPMSEATPPPVLPPFSVKKPEQCQDDSPPIRRLVAWVNQHGLVIAGLGIMMMVVVVIGLSWKHRQAPPSMNGRPSLNLNSLDTPTYSAPSPGRRILFPNLPKETSSTRRASDSSPPREGIRR